MAPPTPFRQIGRREGARGGGTGARPLDPRLPTRSGKKTDPVLGHPPPRPRSGAPTTKRGGGGAPPPSAPSGSERKKTKHGAGQTQKGNDSDTLLSATELGGRGATSRGTSFLPGQGAGPGLGASRARALERNPTLHVWLEVECNSLSVYNDEPPRGSRRGSAPRAHRATLMITRSDPRRRSPRAPR